MSRKPFPRPKRVHLVVFALLAAAPLFAQNAELSGAITDPDRLAIAGGLVSVRSLETGVTRAVLSNQQGEYSVPALPPGSYNLTVEAVRFKVIHQNRVVLEVGQRARVDFSLTLGSKTEIVTVEGNAAPVNVSDASVSTVIGNRFVENLPLNGRSSTS